MKTYTITVNGHAYQVTVEEGASGNPAPQAPAVAAAAPAAVPQQTSAAPAAAPAVASDGVAVKASVPGKIVRLEKNAGDAVASGETVLVLEAMKMEIPVVAPQDGTIASFTVQPGDAVESGDTLAYLS